MKITDLKIHLPLGLLRIQTDAGIEGLSDGCGETCAEFIQQVYRPELLGQDPYHREVIWQRLMHLERLRYPPSNVYRAVVDNALWDLAGKAAGMPVWKLLGGYRDHIPCYRSGPDLETVDEYVEDALRVQALGFKGYKDHCWRGPAVMIDVARALREAVGPDFHLMHDAVQVYEYNGAVKVGRELERQQFTWFEEPLRDFDYLGLRKLCATLEIPIAATEFLPGSIYSTAQVLALRAADIVRASNGWRGGITDHMKIAQLAEAFGVNLEITSLGSNWGFAHANLYGAIKNTTFHENNADLDRDPIVRNPLQVRDGILYMPSGPGLGFDLDPEIVAQRTERIV